MSKYHHPRVTAQLKDQQRKIRYHLAKYGITQAELAIRARMPQSEIARQLRPSQMPCVHKMETMIEAAASIIHDREARYPAKQ